MPQGERISIPTPVAAPAERQPEAPRPEAAAPLPSILASRFASPLGGPPAAQAAGLRRLPAADRPGAILHLQRTQGNRRTRQLVLAAGTLQRQGGFPAAAEPSTDDLLKGLEQAAASSKDPATSRDAVFRYLLAAPYSARKDVRVAVTLDTLYAAGTAERLAGEALQAFGPLAYWPAEKIEEVKKADAALFSLISGLPQQWKIEEASAVSEDRAKKDLPALPPVQAFFVPGRTAEVALVLGGVHGDEPSGVEVAEDLIRKLKALTTPPRFTVVVVPRLFAANVAAGRRETPGAQAQVNRNFPTAGTSVETAATKQDYRGQTGYPLDAKGRPIQPENLALLALIRKFKPTRIASVHAHPDPQSAGVYAEVDRPVDASQQEATAAAEHSRKDSKLALDVAQAVSKRDPTLNQGNKLGTARETSEFPPGPSDKGTSFGESMREPIQEGPYDPGLEDRLPITTLTVEVSGTLRSAESKDPAARAAQLEAYADALLGVFLK